MKLQFKLFLFLLLMVAGASAQVTGPMRPYQAPSLPLAPPSGFVKNRDVLFLPNGTGYIYSSANKWVETTVYYAGVPGPAGANGMNGLQGPQGPQGEPGPKGDPGVCPPCPTGGNTLPSDSGRVVRSWAEFVALIPSINSGAVRTVSLGANIIQTSKWRIGSNVNWQASIKGNNYTWDVRVDTGIGRSYSSLSAANSGIDLRLFIENVNFIGNNNNVCIALEASYGSSIRDCNFTNFKKAIYTGWCMNMIIDHCFYWENYIGVHLDYARFTGGGSATSQPNHTTVQNCKFRNSAGDSCNVKVVAGSGMIIQNNIFGDTTNSDTLTIKHNIFEGVQNGGMYDVFIDDASSNVVKEVTVSNNHFEHIPSVAAIHIRLKDGFAHCINNYSQYDCTLISFESSAYAKIMVQVPYLTTNTKFKTTGGGARWWFMAMPDTFNPASATRWVGSIPINTRYDGWDSNGQKPFIQLGDRRL